MINAPNAPGSPAPSSAKATTLRTATSNPAEVAIQKKIAKALSCFVRATTALDILQRLQKKKGSYEIVISEADFPDVREVDHKLIELAKQIEGKIVTNDFNLNKVAQLRGVSVLNINELANALKPVVLPGEIMRVFVLKEGKEYNQGVAYLDDGTMVVVDNARRMIGKNVDVSVTSVLQTTAGKMIFGRFNEDGRAAANSNPRHTSASQ
jgi:uncharacterized protein YacL